MESDLCPRSLLGARPLVLDAAARIFANCKPGRCIVPATKALQISYVGGGKLRLKEETENPFYQLGLNCRMFQLEGKSDFDASVLWAFCVFAGSVVCRYS